MPPPRRFAQKPSRASKDAGAATYLVMAPNPDARTLARCYGIKPVDAERMVAEQMRKRVERA